MGLIKFLFYRKKDQSILASRKFAEKQVNPEELAITILNMIGKNKELSFNRCEMRMPFKESEEGDKLISK